MMIKINQASFSSVKDLAAYLLKTHKPNQLITKKELVELETNLQMHSILLDEIAHLFSIPPYPDFDQFRAALGKNSREFKSFIKEFDKDPNSMRSAQFQHKIKLLKSKEQIIQEQFDIKNLKQIIQNTVQDQSPLSHKQQYDLIEKITFINAIGKDYPLILNHEQFNLVETSRKALRELSERLIKQIRTPGLAEHLRLEAQLKLVAVFRELYFRVNGIFLNTPQLVTILLALQNQNLAITVNSSKEKSDCLAVIAALQWANAPNTLDIATANPQQDFLRSADFFSSIGIRSSHTDASGENYQIGSINYGSLRDLSLLRLDKDDPYLTCSPYLIISEADFSNLNTSTFFNKAINSEGLIDITHPAAQQTQYVSMNDFVAAYQKHGHITVLSDTLSSQRGFDALSDKLGLAVNYQLPAQNATLNSSATSPKDVIKNHYLGLITGKQQLALQQFDEWHAFLHLLYPPIEWPHLDADLLKQRESLKTRTENLGSSILEDVKNKLQPAYLNRAVALYELELARIWTLAQAGLEEKTQGKIIPESVNQLRYHYLKNMPFTELLQLHKIAVRQNKKERVQSKQKSKIHMESSLNVYGALLKYSSGSVQDYIDPYLKNQRDLLTVAIKKAINHSSIKIQIKKILHSRLDHAKNLLALELVLLDIPKWVAAHSPQDKYYLQPVVRELLKTYRRARLEASNELIQLKMNYIDNVSNELINMLQSNLSWVFTKNWEYWLERNIVKEAAKDIFLATEQLKKATTVTVQQLALQNLYQKLVIHQAQLADTWIVSFGHKNTLQLINETLATLDSLTVMGNNKITASFIQESKEVAYARVMKMQTEQAFERFAKKNPDLNKFAHWNRLTAQFALIKKENESVYAIDEVYHLLRKKCNEIKLSNPQLHKRLISLKEEIAGIGRKHFKQNKVLFNGSRHFDYKASQLAARFKTLPKANITQVRLKPVHTGFNRSFDLILEGTGTHPFLDNFVRYNSPLTELTQEREKLTAAIKDISDAITFIENGQIKILPHLKLPKVNIVNLELFPKEVHAKIQDILFYKSFAEGKLPTDLSVFSEEIQQQFMDRALLNTSLEALDIKDVKQIKNKSLRSLVNSLYKKLHEKPKPKSLASRMAQAVFSQLSWQETEEDLQYQFAELKVGDYGPGDTVLLNNMSCAKLEKGDIAKINDKQLQAQLLLFYKKLKDLRKKPTSWFNNTVDALFKTKLNAQDLQDVFAKCKAESFKSLQDFLVGKINHLIAEVDSDLGRLADRNLNEYKLLNEKLSFIDGKIKSEQQNSGLLVRRFESIEQLYDFEEKLRTIDPAAGLMPPKVKPLVVIADSQNDWDAEIRFRV